MRKNLDNDYILKLTTEFPHCSRIISLVKKLLHNWISMRQNCEGILRDRHMWEIGFEEIQSNDILQNMSHQNWNSYFYGRRDCVNLSTLVVMKKVQFEVEKNFKSAISKEINNRLTIEYSGIRDINRADVINMNSNMFQLFRNDLGIFLPLILHSLNISYSLEQLNLFLENKLEDNFSSKWQCFSSVAPIASFPKIINWYNCKYFFMFFYSSVIQKSFIQVMLINTINIKYDSNDSEVYFPIKSSMTKEMTEKSVTFSLNEINKNLSIEELQKSICSQMNQLYNNHQWHCYIAKSELFLAYYDMFNHEPDIEQMNAFRIKDYCIIIASSPFTATPFKNIKLTHRKIWKNISADEELILKSSMSPNIGFFQSIHLKKVTGLNNQTYFVRITHKPTDLFRTSIHNWYSNYCFKEIEAQISKINETTEHKSCSDNYLDQNKMLKKNTVNDSTFETVETLIKDIEEINFLETTPDKFLIAIKNTRKLAEFEQHNRIIKLGILDVLLDFLMKNTFDSDKKKKSRNEYELQYETLYTLFEFHRYGINEYKHFMTRLNCVPIFIQIISNSRDDNICYFATRILLAIIGCCQKCRDCTLENGIVEPLLSLIKPNKSLAFLKIISSAIGKFVSNLYTMPEINIIKKILSSVAKLLDHSDDNIIDISLNTVECMYRDMNYRKNFASLMSECEITPRIISLLDLDNSSILALVLMIFKQIAMVSIQEYKTCNLFDYSVLLKFNKLLKHEEFEIRWNSLNVLKNCIFFKNSEQINSIIEAKLITTIVENISSDDLTLDRNAFDILSKVIENSNEQQLFDICNNDLFQPLINLLDIEDEFITDHVLDLISRMKTKNQLVGDIISNCIERSGKSHLIEQLKNNVNYDKYF
jgi:importin subunit alpha-2